MLLASNRPEILSLLVCQMYQYIPLPILYMVLYIKLSYVPCVNELVFQ